MENYFYKTKILFNRRGTFRIEREDGHAFDCRIPPFSLGRVQHNYIGTEKLTLYWPHGNCNPSSESKQEEANDPQNTGS